MPNTICPLCSGKCTTLFPKLRDHFLSAEEFEVLQCEVCGFGFTLDPPPENEIGKYYKSENYISHSNTRKGITNHLYHIARKWMLKKKFSLSKRASGLGKGKLLDIGCGTGYFAAYMKDKSWDSIGIEADPDAKKFAEDNFGIEVFSLDKLSEFKPTEFNLVTMWHVLEHLNSPKEILKNISRILDKDGLCIIALPNSDSYDAQHYKDFWAAWDVPRHLWHFNISSFSRLVEETGLHLKEVKKMPLDSFYISLLSEKYKGSGPAFLKGMTHGKIGWIKSWFRKSEASSLIYILGKSS